MLEFLPYDDSDKSEFSEERFQTPGGLDSEWAIGARG